jgi:hypothetical protein
VTTEIGVRERGRFFRMLPDMEPLLDVATGISAEALEAELCLYREADAEVLVLNHTAADIWRLCDGTRTRALLVEDLALAYGEAAERIGEQVDAVLDDLLARGFLVQAVPRAGSDG